MELVKELRELQETILQEEKKDMKEKRRNLRKA
jgi:hypothetical protein